MTATTRKIIKHLRRRLAARCSRSVSRLRAAVAIAWIERHVMLELDEVEPQKYDAMATASVLARPRRQLRSMVGAHPAMNIGANTVFNTTVSTCTTMVGLTIPVPRRAEPIATIANCRRGRADTSTGRRACGGGGLIGRQRMYVRARECIPGNQVTIPRIADIRDGLVEDQVGLCLILPSCGMGYRARCSYAQHLVSAMITMVTLPAAPTPASAHLPVLLRK